MFRRDDYIDETDFKCVDEMDTDIPDDTKAKKNRDYFRTDKYNEKYNAGHEMKISAERDIKEQKEQTGIKKFSGYIFLILIVFIFMGKSAFVFLIIAVISMLINKADSKNNEKRSGKKKNGAGCAGVLILFVILAFAGIIILRIFFPDIWYEIYMSLDH